MNARPFTHLPQRLDDTAELAAVLNKLGITTTQITASALETSRGSGRFTINQIDNALAKTQLSTADRLAVKMAIAHRGLIGG